MFRPVDSPCHLIATVQDVWPLMGLAYAVDSEDRCWGITRHTPGAPIDALRVGEQVSLTIERYDGFSIASAWSPLD